MNFPIVSSNTHQQPVPDTLHGNAPALPDFKKMSPDEFLAWCQEEPETTPLHHFPLHEQEGRKVFLREFYGFGPGSLFEAVSHVWSSLAEPAAARCTGMGLIAKTGGSGKQALYRVLNEFVTRAMAIDNPIPSRDGYDSFASWDQAARSTFKQDEDQLEQLVCHYEPILDGKSPQTVPAEVIEAQILPGPWSPCAVDD